MGEIRYARLDPGAFLATALVLAPRRARRDHQSRYDRRAGGLEAEECALREAVLAANSDAPFGGCKTGEEGDSIVLEAKTYFLTRSGSGEDMTMRGDLDVTGELKIRGAGQNKTTIDGRTLRIATLTGNRVPASS